MPDKELLRFESHIIAIKWLKYAHVDSESCCALLLARGALSSSMRSNGGADLLEAHRFSERETNLEFWAERKYSREPRSSLWGEDICPPRSQCFADFYLHLNGYNY
jgi:hypothetical protein